MKCLRGGRTAFFSLRLAAESLVHKKEKTRNMNFHKKVRENRLYAFD